MNKKNKTLLKLKIKKLKRLKKLKKFLNKKVYIQIYLQ